MESVLSCGGKRAELLYRVMRSVYLVMLAAPLFAAAPTAAIKVDQAGYLPNARKVAFVVANPAATEFTIRAMRTGVVAFVGKLGAAVDDPDSGDKAQAA